MLYQMATEQIRWVHWQTNVYETLVIVQWTQGLVLGEFKSGCEPHNILRWCAFLTLDKKRWPDSQET